jgi:hypothetical protein
MVPQALPLKQHPIISFFEIGDQMGESDWALKSFAHPSEAGEITQKTASALPFATGEILKEEQLSNFVLLLAQLAGCLRETLSMCTSSHPMFQRLGGEKRKGGQIAPG